MTSMAESSCITTDQDGGNKKQKLLRCAAISTLLIPCKHRLIIAVIAFVKNNDVLIAAVPQDVLTKKSYCEKWYCASQCGTTTLNCDILRVFFGDQFLLFHATSHEINVIHKLIVIVLFCYINPPNQMSHILTELIPVRSICHTPIVIRGLDVSLSPFVAS